MTGIYKITSPSGRIYVGQAVDIARRISIYKGMHCKHQSKLYASFLKYGFASHSFEMIEECPESDLNEREEFYIKTFNSTDQEAGLNLQSGGRSRRQSEESKKKISLGHMGKKKPWLAEMNRKRTGEKRSQEVIDKIIAFRTGARHTPESIAKMKANAGRHVRSESTRKKMSESAKKKVLSEDHKRKLKEWSEKGHLAKVTSKEVIDLLTGQIYTSLAQLCREKELPYDNTKAQVNGRIPNRTTFRFAT